tara:strand:- start:1434 stop:1853 length:420 start_codon:yes stop_codon:yes gene_type:complete
MTMANLNLSEKSVSQATSLLSNMGFGMEQLSRNLIDSVSMAYEDGLLSPQSEQTLSEAASELQEQALMVLSQAFRSWMMRESYPNAAKMWESLKENPELLMSMATNGQEFDRETESETPFKQALDEALQIDSRNPRSRA